MLKYLDHKRLALLLAFISGLYGVTFPVCAQTNTWEWGIQTAVNIGSVLPKAKIEAGSSGKIILGPNIGLYGQYYLNKNWAITLNLSYSYKGADFFQAVHRDTMLFDIPQLSLFDFPAPYTALNIKGYMNQHYIEMPLHVQYMPNSKIGILLGLQTAYLLQGHSRSTQDIYVGTDLNTPFLTYLDSLVDISDQYKKWDWAVSLGGNFKLKSRWSIGLRASYSLSSIYRQELRQLQKGFANLFATFSISYAIRSCSKKNNRANSNI